MKVLMLSEFYDTRGINMQIEFRFLRCEVILSNNIESMNARPDIVHMLSHFAAHRQTRKGVQFFIPLLSKCLKEHDAELIIAGKDEMFMPALLKLQGSLCENVKVLGFVPRCQSSRTLQLR